MWKAIGVLFLTSGCIATSLNKPSTARITYEKKGEEIYYQVDAKAAAGVDLSRVIKFEEVSEDGSIHISGKGEVDSAKQAEAAVQASAIQAELIGAIVPSIAKAAMEIALKYLEVPNEDPGT
jgi:hypothetical protein